MREEEAEGEGGVFWGAMRRGEFGADAINLMMYIRGYGVGDRKTKKKRQGRKESAGKGRGGKGRGGKGTGRKTTKQKKPNPQKTKGKSRRGER